MEILTRGRARFGVPEVGLQIGSKANLTLFNPDTEYVQTEATIQSTSKNSMYIGKSLLGKAYGVLVGTKSTV